MSEIGLKKGDKGWIVELPEEFTKEIGLEKGSIAVLYGGNGKVETEIITPISSELEKSVDRIYDKWEDAFTEIKRLGD